ncbi:hypothetical protein ACFVZD_43595 [Streptomyces sp. NPDC058287]|uniref:hypothetical protein n=1 Tax=unclassified Streptomyces TaxID=2593676 RepID=UPI0036F07BC8
MHFEWDRYDDLLARKDELGHTSRFTYDESGNLRTIAYPDGRHASTTYNACTCRRRSPGRTARCGGSA